MDLDWTVVDAGVDAGACGCRQHRQRKHGLSRRKLEALRRTRTADPSLPSRPRRRP
jgi:hypothetical protein